MTNGSNGRKTNGKFAKGWQGGPGGDHSHSLEFKKAYQEAITAEDMHKVALMVLDIALNSKDEKNRLVAAAELSNRLLGRPAEMVFEGDQVNNYPVLITTTAEAMKKLEAQRSLGDDPYCGRKRLPNRGTK